MGSSLLTALIEAFKDRNPGEMIAGMLKTALKCIFKLARHTFQGYNKVGHWHVLHRVSLLQLSLSFPHPQSKHEHPGGKKRRTAGIQKCRGVGVGGWGGSSGNIMGKEKPQCRLWSSGPCQQLACRWNIYLLLIDSILSAPTLDLMSSPPVTLPSGHNRQRHFESRRTKS